MILDGIHKCCQSRVSLQTGCGFVFSLCTVLFGVFISYLVASKRKLSSKTKEPSGVVVHTRACVFVCELSQMGKYYVLCTLCLYCGAYHVHFGHLSQEPMKVCYLIFWSSVVGWARCPSFMAWGWETILEFWHGICQGFWLDDCFRPSWYSCCCWVHPKDGLSVPATTNAVFDVVVDEDHVGDVNDFSADLLLFSVYS